MARKIVYIDDLTGTEAEEIETIKYSFDGKNYEIDLIDENAKKFRAAVAPFIAKSRTIEPQLTTHMTRGMTERDDRRAGIRTGNRDTNTLPSRLPPDNFC